MSSWTFLFSYVIYLHYSLAGMIDNELVGDPTVDCEDTMVTLTFKTKKPFTGRVFVQGLADDDRCSRNFASNSDQSKFSMMIQNGDCTMARQRVSGTLEGVMLSLTIVVSFHGTFVTKADRAYRTMCFFRNIKRLTHALDMNPIKAKELLDTAKMPTCTYSLHEDNADGPPVKLGTVGQRIFHVWQCDDAAHAFLVHSCWVDDGRGSRFDLLDIDGCAIDPIIQPDVVYETDINRAYAETWGYKFSDTSVLNYQCIVELCKKSAGECEELTPPLCGRKKRAVIFGSPNKSNVTHREDNQMDLLTSLNILDGLPEKSVSDTPLPPRVLRESFPLVPPFHRPTRTLTQECLFTLALGIGFTMLVCASAMIITISYMTRRRIGSQK